MPEGAGTRCARPRGGSPAEVAAFSRRPGQGSPEPQVQQAAGMFGRRRGLGGAGPPALPLGGGFPCLPPARGRGPRSPAGPFVGGAALQRSLRRRAAACAGRLGASPPPGAAALVRPGGQAERGSLPRPVSAPARTRGSAGPSRDIRRLGFGAAASRRAAGRREPAGGQGALGGCHRAPWVELPVPSGCDSEALPAPETRGWVSLGVSAQDVAQICPPSRLAGTAQDGAAELLGKDPKQFAPWFRFRNGSQGLIGWNPVCARIYFNYFIY